MIPPLTSEIESDWLIEDYTSNQAKEALLLSMTAFIQIAKQCCSPSLGLDEIEEIMETVWYEMESQDSQSVPV